MAAATQKAARARSKPADLRWQHCFRSDVHAMARKFTQRARRTENAHICR